MISRLPLDLFEDPEEPTAPADAPATPADEEPGEAVDQVIESGPPAEPDAVFLVSCQWCAARFDNELEHCPECNAKHVRVQPPAAESTTVTCQWCLTTFDSGPTACPECSARVVVPGQNVPGEHDIPFDFNSYGMLARRAHTNQMLAGMMLGGGLDAFAAGLIGLAVTLLDDD